MSSSSILLSGHPQSIQTRPIDENRCLYKILKHGIFLKSEPCKSRLNSEKTGNHRYDVSLEHMFMNDKQSKLVRSSTAQCNDLPKQMQARRSLTTSVDNCLSTSIAGTYIYCNGNQSQLNRYNGSPFIKTQRNCHWSYTSPTRYLNKSSTTTNNQQQQQLLFYGISSIQVHRLSHRG